MQQKQQKPEEQNSKNRRKYAQLNRKSKLKTARYVAIVKN
jgi:IS1 family transposase